MRDGRTGMGLLVLLLSLIVVPAGLTAATIDEEDVYTGGYYADGFYDDDWYYDYYDYDFYDAGSGYYEPSDDWYDDDRDEQGLFDF